MTAARCAVASGLTGAILSAKDDKCAGDRPTRLRSKMAKAERVATLAAIRTSMKAREKNKALRSFIAAEGGAPALPAAPAKSTIARTAPLAAPGKPPLQSTFRLQTFR